MFVINRLVGFGGASGNSGSSTLKDWIEEQGLLASTILCVDLSDPASYPGTGQTLTDVVNGANFYFGATSSATTDDPTYNAGPPAYGSVDGGDFWRLINANPAAIDALHKDNAAWGGIAAIYLGATSVQALLGTRGGDFVPGFEIRIGDSGATMRLGVDNSGGSFNALDKTGGSTFSTGQWYVIGWSIAEATGAGGGFLWRNGAYNQVAAADTFDATYASPSASAAGYKLELLAGGNGTGKAPSGSRLNCCALFSAAPSKAQLDGIFGAAAGLNLRGRLGL